MRSESAATVITVYSVWNESGYFRVGLDLYSWTRRSTAKTNRNFACGFDVVLFFIEKYFLFGGIFMKKLLSIILAVTIFAAAFGVISVSAEENDKTVSVIVVNNTYSKENGAPWSGVLFNATVTLGEDDSMESVIERAVSENDYSFTVSDYGYISEINGLTEYAYNGSGGWMATLNNWFTADGTGAYTVANGGLQSGDEIVMMYTCAWGADVGSLYGDFNTTLSVDEFGFRGSYISEATTQEFFVPEILDYTIEINASEDVISFLAVPTNKNYQARVYKNEYQPDVNGAEYRGGKNVPVKDGDVIYIGVGNPSWPTMNSWAGTAEETVYTFKIKYVPLLGDLNGNGKLDIDDVTILQRSFAEFEELSEKQKEIADINGDKAVDILDATAIQRVIAEFDA